MYQPGQMGASNTSGQGPGSPVPAEVQGLNWGGFFWSWIWAIFNNAGALWIIIGLFIPLVANIYLLVKGNELAWQNKQWASVEAFKSTQRKWMIAGLIYIGVVIVLACISIIFSALAASSSGN